MLAWFFGWLATPVNHIVVLVRKTQQLRQVCPLPRYWKSAAQQNFLTSPQMHDALLIDSRLCDGKNKKTQKAPIERLWG